MRLFGLLSTVVGFDSAAITVAVVADVGSFDKLALGLRHSLLLLFNITGIRESVLAPSSAVAVESTVSFAVASATRQELSD